MIDLRSDTLTRPTPGMRRAMAEAEVGDDVYDEDPEVHALQDEVAALLGKEASLFTPTGSMANVLAVSALVGPGQELLCESRAHVLRAELGAHGALLGITTRTWADPGGRPDLAQIESLHAPDMGPFFVRTAAVSVENTHNFAGGTVVGLERLRALRAWADEHAVAIHLDGARLWNAHVATGASLADLAGVADAAAVCLSKGLGAPIGSLFVGTAEQVAVARVLRKRLGGGMRQVGVLAAAGRYALAHHVERLAEDHEHARLLAEAVGVDPETVETNIVVLDVPDGSTAAAYVVAAEAVGVRVGAVGTRRVRMLTHLDVSRADVDRACVALLGLAG